MIRIWGREAGFYDVFGKFVKSMYAIGFRLWGLKARGSIKGGICFRILAFRVSGMWERYVILRIQIRRIWNAVVVPPYPQP